MGKGFSQPRSFRGSGDLRVLLEKNWRALLAFINNYIPTLDEDGTSISFPGNVTVGGNILLGVGNTVDGVDPSAHAHDAIDGSIKVDHGNLLGLSDDDHTIYSKADGTRAFTGVVAGVTPTADSHLATKGYVDGKYEGARAYRTTSQVIATATWTSIGFDAESYDDNGYHDNATNNTRMTAPAAGRYRVTGNCQFDTNTTGRRSARFYVNGTDVFGTVQGGATGYRGSPIVTDVLDLAANDYVEYQVYQDSGGNLDVFGTEGATYFIMERVA